ncbi:MAG TPA: hypothetical protein VE998_13035, partial [Terriglobales bacterium]|nr:hypothetical protein [Terriglobales bacterium]
PNNPEGAAAHSENRYHLREFNRDEFAQLLSAYFSEVTIFGQELTAAYLAAHRIWMNPAFRLGAFLQRLKGRAPYRFPAPTESDWIITEYAREPANFVAVCRRPRRP